MVSERERGSEMVQFLVVVPLVLLVLAAALQVGAVMLSIDRLTADVTRACRQLDAAGLSLAADKERFVKDELLGAATQLQPELLTVRDVRLSFDSDANSSLALAHPGSVEDGLLVIEERTSNGHFSFDVAYELPSLAAIPGMEHRSIARHVECARTEGRVVEVEVSPL